MTAGAAGTGTFLALPGILGGGQAQDAANVQAAQDVSEAGVARMQAGAEISNETENAAKTISKVEAGAGAGGVTADSARPVLSEDYTQAKIRAAYVRFGGKLTSSEDLYAASLAK